MPAAITVDAAYKTFATFVNSAKSGDTVATVNNLGQISASKGSDFVGNIFRGADAKKANQKVRAYFQDTVCRLLGVATVDKLPASVRALLHSEDYGKGKPLSARRISIVLKQVNTIRAARAAAASPQAAAARGPAASPQAGAARGPAARPQAGAARGAAANPLDVAANTMVASLLKVRGWQITPDNAKSIIAACNGDRLAIDFLSKHPEVIFTPSYGSAMRQTTVEGQLRLFLDNVKDLRAAANGDERIVHAGFKFLEENLSTPSIFTGLFREMVSEAGSINMDSLKAFSNPHASVEARHTALVKLEDSIGAAAGTVAGKFPERAQVFGGPLGQINVKSLQSFLAVAAFSKLDSATCAHVARQFESSETKQLMGMYYHLGYEASHSFVTDKADFVPKAGDGFDGRAMLAAPANPGSGPNRQAVVISRLMFREGPSNAPMFGTVESLLQMSFSLEKAARARSGAVGAGATLGDRFVSSSSPRMSHPVSAKDATQSMSADAQYAVKRDIVIRTCDRVFTGA